MVSSLLLATALTNCSYCQLKHCLFSLVVLSPNAGKLVLYGLMGGPYLSDSSFLPRLLSKRLSVVASTLRSRTVSYKEELIRLLTEDKAGFPTEANGIKVHVDKTFPLEQAQAAHEYMASNKNAGKIVLVV